MRNFKANLLATGIGSIPHKDVKTGARFVLDNFTDIPFWPQLPRLSFFENMYVQYSRRLPGVVIESERMFIDTAKAEDELEKFYTLYLEGMPADFALTSEYAAGFYELFNLKDSLGGIRAIKGHITGPISFGLQVTDEKRRAVIYNDTLGDAVIKNLSRIAAWQEQQLAAINPNTIMFIDEPYLSSFGSAYVSLTREEVISALNEVVEPLQGLSAIHCCGNTDWSLLLDSNVDIVSLDAYNFGLRLSLYLDKLKIFLARGGIIAWGITPTDKESIDKEDMGSLIIRLENIWAELDKQGIPVNTWRHNSLITPACGVGSLDEDTAAKVFSATVELSKRFRQKYGLV